MKYLLLLAIFFAAFLLWRGNRRAAQDATAAAKSVVAPQDMTACALCDLHVPRADALPGPGGHFYCSAEHRQRAGT